MDLKSIQQLANENAGILAFIGVILALAPLLYQLWRKFHLQRERRRSDMKKEVAHAEAMKKEVESHVEWNDFSYYGEMQIRDIERVLPKSEENHNSEKSPYSILTLTGIHNEHLEFLEGCLGVKSIKNIAGYWHYADESDEDAITVETLVCINYRDIECFRWETNEYWEWPQVCCRFSHPKKFPVSKVLYVQQVKGSQKPYFRTICRGADVTEMPSALVKSQ